MNSFGKRENERGFDVIGTNPEDTGKANLAPFEQKPCCTTRAAVWTAIGCFAGLAAVAGFLHAISDGHSRGIAIVLTVFAGVFASFIPLLVTSRQNNKRACRRNDNSGTSAAG